MKKYIDADKLIAEINERLMAVNLEKLGNFGAHRVWAYNDVKDIIASLQDEQPKSTCKNCGFYENNCPFIRGKLIPYPNNVCKDYIYSAMKEQEQPMPDSTKLIELWHQDKEMLKEKDFRDDPWRLAYNAFMCGFGRGIAVNKQEHPEVDFEEEWEKFDD